MLTHIRLHTRQSCLYENSVWQRSLWGGRVHEAIAGTHRITILAQSRLPITDTSLQLVKNVHEFSEHIACDSASESEVVVPLHDGDKVRSVESSSSCASLPSLRPSLTTTPALTPLGLWRARYRFDCALWVR